MERQKNIPKLRFSEFEGEWENMELGAIGSTYNGLTGKSRDDFGEGKPYIQYKQIFDDSKIDVTRFEYVRIDTKEKQNRVLFGDVFFTVSSETPNEIGTASVLLDNVDELYLNSFCFGYRSSHQILSPWFARYLFRSELFRNEIVKLAQGSTRYNMSKAALMKLIVGLPTLPEQQKIASFFTAIDQKISQLKRKETLLEQYKKGVMQKIFSQEIRFKDDNGQEFPKWEKKRLGDVFTEINESVGERDIPTYSITAGIGFVSQKEKFGRNISGQQNKNYTVIDEGQFSYNKGNSKTYKYGCVYLNDTGEKIAVPNVFISFERVDPKMSTKYYSKLFESHYLDKELRKIISSSARMDGLLNVNKNSFFKLKVPCPNHYEQHKIGDFLCSLDNKIQNTQKQIEQAEQWKKGLMQQMFV